MTEFWNHILQISCQPQQLSMMVCHCKRKCSTQKCCCKSRNLACTNLCLCNNEGQNDDDVHADDDINSQFLRRQYSVLWWTLNYDLNNISNRLLAVPHPNVMAWLSRPFCQVYSSILIVRCAMYFRSVLVEICNHSHFLKLMTLLNSETNVSIFIENFLAAILDIQNGRHQRANFVYYSATTWDTMMNLVDVPTFWGSREMMV